MISLRTSLVLALVLAGCHQRAFTLGVGPRPSGQTYTAPQNAQTIRASGPPSNMISQLTQLMQSRGWQPLGAPIRNPGLPANGTIAYSLVGQPGYCYVAAAISEDTSADLNIMVTGPDQRTVASDVHVDGHPSATFCASYPGTYIVRLNFRGNGGPFYFSAYQGARSTTPDLAAFYGSDVNNGTPVAAIEASTQNRITETDQYLTGRGFQRVGEAVPVALTQREERTFPVQLESGFCYAFASTVNSTIGDSDLFLSANSGRNVAEDRNPSRDARIQYCATETGQYQLRTRAYQGNGTLFVTSYVRPQENTQTVAATPTAPILSNTNGVASNSLDEAFALADAELRARGYETYAARSDGELAERATRETPLELEGGKCYAISAAGADGVRNLDLFLITARGQTLDRDIEQGSSAVVRVCPESTGTYTARVLLAQGEGRFSVQAYRWPRGTRGPFGLQGVIFLRLAEMMQLLSTEGYEPDLDYSPERGNLPRATTRGTHTLSLAANTCYAVLAVGGDGVSDLGITLSRSGTTLESDRSTNSFPLVYRCTTTAEEDSLEVRAESGTGDYVVQLFKRTTPAQ